MKQIDILAQDIMDLYYGDFKEENEDFFDIDFFIRQVEDTHAFILREEYKQMYAMLRADNRHKVDMVSIPDRWLVRGSLEVKSDKDAPAYVALKNEIFSFPYDQTSCGVQDVIPLEDCTLIRSSYSDVWKEKFTGKIGRWFIIPDNEGVKIGFKNYTGKVEVLYVPVAGAKTFIDEGLADQIKDIILNRMFKAKSGEGVIDKTNDSNPNAIPETEINKQ
jgi:hypothetical protein